MSLESFKPTQKQVQRVSWWINQSLSVISLWDVVSGVLVVWIIGVWVWILPQYNLYQSDIQHEIDRLEHFSKTAALSRPKVQSSAIAQKLPELSYEQLLIFSNQHHLHLIEYRSMEKARNHARHQCVLRGEWLSIREFLNDIQPIISHDFQPIIINEMTLVRDTQTNLVSVTLLLEANS